MDEAAQVACVEQDVTLRVEAGRAARIGHACKDTFAKEPLQVAV
jgi:hypothetical protein